MAGGGLQAASASAGNAAGERLSDACAGGAVPAARSHCTACWLSVRPLGRLQQRALLSCRTGDNGIALDTRAMRSWQHWEPGPLYERSVHRRKMQKLVISDRHAELLPSHSQNVEEPVRILVSTGDVMGDIHGAALIKELLEQAEAAGRAVQVYALGGPRMREAGAILIGSNERISSIGLWEAVPLILPALKLQARAKRFLREHPPHAVVLMDYPGVNIPFAGYLKRTYGCPITYYIPPNEWLLSSTRTAAIVDTSDTILAVYDREREYYANAGGRVKFIGHPLLDRFQKPITREEARRVLGESEGATLVALLPGSRLQELRLVWPTLARSAALLLDRMRNGGSDCTDGHSLRFIIPVAADHLAEGIRAEISAHGLDHVVRLWQGDSRIAMAAADLALTKSGSVTVELALLNVPQVVVYRVSAVTAWIARRVLGFSLPFVSLVNLILEENVVPEFIQEQAEAEAVAEAAFELLLLPAGGRRSAMQEGYRRLRRSLGEPGASRRAAHHVLASAGVLPPPPS